MGDWKCAEGWRVLVGKPRDLSVYYMHTEKLQKFKPGWLWLCYWILGLLLYVNVYMSKQSTRLLQSEPGLKWLKKPVCKTYWMKWRANVSRQGLSGYAPSNLKIWRLHMLNKEFNCLWYTIQIALREYSITQHIAKSYIVCPVSFAYQTWHSQES